jgi:hypothetical protein
MGESYVEVESFKFADVMRHWARERLVHEVTVGRELARGVIRDGLRFQSVDPHWTKPTVVLRGEPLVGYTARPDLLPVLVCAEALEHLLAVSREAMDPDLRLLGDEYVTKAAFRDWLVHTGRPLPAFWFASTERGIAGA